MIEIPNVELLAFRDMLVEGKMVPRKDFMEMDPQKLGEIPIQFKVGAVKYTIGVINTFRIGANAMTGDLYIEIKGNLVMKLVGDKPKPAAYVFTVEK